MSTQVQWQGEGLVLGDQGGFLSPRELPPQFVRWQFESRRAMFERIAQDDFIPQFGAHLPVLVTHDAKGLFPAHTANKGTGFTPKDEFLDHYIHLFQDALAACVSRPTDETRPVRLAAIRQFYDHPERMDLRRLGLLEIFQGQTYQNIQADHRATLHYTDNGPQYRSYQLNGWIEIVGPGDRRYEFLCAARQLFEYERFHIQQPAYPLGYIFWVAEVYDKSPHHGRAGQAMATNSSSLIAAHRPAAIPEPADEAVTFREILVPVDNSKHSAWARDVALQIAAAFGSTVVGSHVYAARLHDRRFRDMEPGLPDEYQHPAVLSHQRQLHDTLIEKGLRLISESFLEILKQRCQQAGLTFQGKTLEGKNYAELVGDIESSGYDLVAMGARGLGGTWRHGERRDWVLGSVCERVVRRVTRDVLIVKNDRPLGGTFVVGIDGSDRSFAALRVALVLAAACGARVQAIAAYDPVLHKAVFHELEQALTAEAKAAFNTEQQKKLHDQLIDGGIAKIYQDHLETALHIATAMGAEVETRLLAGKAYAAIWRHLHELRPTLLAIGRTGVHADEGLDIGSTAENLLRLAPCHVLLVGQSFIPTPAEASKVAGAGLNWTPEALARLERVPPFAQRMARKAIEEYARQQGVAVVDEGVMQEARQRLGM